MEHLTTSRLEAGLDEIRKSPSDGGTVEMICRRPKTEEREGLEAGELTTEEGLVGDNWKDRGRPNKDAQVTLMNARAAALVAQDRARWALAGDQVFVDIDLSVENLPAGSRLRVGDAVIEVTALPHTGCKKFVARFGQDAMTFVNSEVGSQMRLRGVNTRVVQSGAVRRGDAVVKIDA